jgi:class 3 adenylate cyclase/outer membrane protein OmpA-like peptidoglycan-associated protein
MGHPREVGAMTSAGEGRVERRLAAILAADVVGYSRLMGLNEEGTHAAVKAIWSEVTDPRINEHHGRVVNTMGDGLLVEFASAVDAVRCAFDIQRDMKRRNELKPTLDPIVFRIGINVSDIIGEDADIIGDGVNIAARIEGLAEPGGICVSRSVRDQVRDKLGYDFEDLGQRRVKNIARPVHVFKIPLDAPALPRADGAGKTGAADPGKLGGAEAVKTRPASRRRGPYLAAAVGGAATILVAATLFAKFSAGPTAAPPPLVGDPIFFDRGKVTLSRWARATLAQQASVLHDHPSTTVTVKTYCADDEGTRAGLQVLTQLRANQIRDTLEAQGVASGRIRLELACGAGSAALPTADQAKSGQTPHALLIRN